MANTMSPRHWLYFALLVCCGCATPPALERARLTADVQARFGAGVGAGPRAGVVVPAGLEQGTPFSEDEAVVLALWNNAAFHEALMELDIFQADLVQAGLLTNPEFFYSFPVSGRDFRYLLDVPLEVFWLRPIRLKAAEAENARACGRVTQLALDLIRDTRLAYNDLRLAEDQRKVSQRSVELRKEIARLAEVRLKAGDASELDAATANLDALIAQQDLIRAGVEVTAVQERLRNFTGLSAYGGALATVEAPLPRMREVTVEELVAEAAATRPDAQAAANAAIAAAERLRLAELSWFRVFGILDATSGNPVNTLGPAFRVTLPIFNQGQGVTARAAAEYEQLERRRLTVFNQIVLEVRTAYARFQQATAELELLRSKTKPEVEKTIRQAEDNFKEGNVTYLLVLEANRQLITTLAREAQLNTDARRATVELERAVGRRLDPPATVENRR